jgi:hypothetical protein
MPYSVSGGEPAVDGVLGSAFADALELSKKNLRLALIMIVLGAVIGFAFALTSRGREDMLQGALVGCDLAIVVVSYYAIAAAVRTLNPSYRMTVGQFFGILGYSLLAGLLTMVASFVFIIPAFWVGPKVLLTPYTYAITNGAPGALEKTWNMTTGYYWPTLGFLILLGLAVGVLAMVAFGIAGALIYMAPILAIVGLPIAIAVYVWLLHVQALAYVRWTASLLQRVEPNALTPTTV